MDYVTGHIKDPVPLIEKSRASCPSGRFPNFIQDLVIVITRLNKLYDCMFFGLKIALDADRRKTCT